MSRLKRQLSRLTGLGPPEGKGPVAPAPPGPQAGVRDEIASARVAALRARLAGYRGRRPGEPAAPAYGPYAPASALVSASALGPASNLVSAPASAGGTGADFELPGAWEETSDGGMHVLRVGYAPDHLHGSVRVADGLRATGAHMALLGLDDGLVAVDGTSVLYLDTETTGLSGGAGTLPFLIGLGGFVDGAWSLEQLFLRRPGEEAPMLHYLAARMRRASAVVTYNGKSFDWPLLRTRFVLNRVPLPPPLPHLDLLHCVRRLLPQLAGRARLCRVERMLLNFERVDDVDGALIPQLYFDFLRGGPVAPMARVMTHNAHDLAALAAVLGVFAARLEATPVVTVSDRECLAMARLHERRGDVVQAHAWAERAAVAEAHALRGRLFARAGDFPAAVGAWQRALAPEGGHALQRAEVHLSLAKVYEHRLKDITAALVHAPHTGPVEGPAPMAHRVARLRRKLEVLCRSSS